jgi:signal transduction histidine kinase
MGGALDEATGWQTRLAELEGELQIARAELNSARAELADAHAEVQAELSRGVEVAGRAEQAEQELSMLREQQMEASTDPGHDELEEIARVAEERLASQTEKLTETEDRAQSAEQQLQEALGRLGELEDALRLAADGDGAAAQQGRTESSDAAIDDRRASTPFMKELSLDAKKTLTQILGITLSLKHKKTAQEQAPFLRQLSAMAKRLDRTVSDLAEADKLVHGEIEMNIRRTNLESLVERVVDESGVGGEHDVRVETEELVVGVDPLRTEQILNSLLRNSADRTSPGSEITVRLKHEDEGALLSVEDKEASSDGSLSPVVSKLADVMGGWAKVESRPNGGSAFRVYLPDQSGGGVTTPKDGEDTLQITVENPSAASEAPAEPVDFSEAGDDDPWAAGQLLVQELQRLSHQEGK